MRKPVNKTKVHQPVSANPKPVFPPAVKQHRAAIAALETRLADLQRGAGLSGSAEQNNIRYQISQHQTSIDALMKQAQK